MHNFIKYFILEYGPLSGIKLVFNLDSSGNFDAYKHAYLSIDDFVKRYKDKNITITVHDIDEHKYEHDQVFTFIDNGIMNIGTIYRYHE